MVDNGLLRQTDKRIGTDYPLSSAYSFREAIRCRLIRSLELERAKTMLRDVAIRFAPLIRYPSA